MVPGYIFYRMPALKNHVPAPPKMGVAPPDFGSQHPELDPDFKNADDACAMEIVDCIDFLESRYPWLTDARPG